MNTAAFSDNIFVIIIIALAVIAAAAWLLIRGNRKTTVIGSETQTRDVLDEGAERAQRNQALIDAPRAPAIVQGPLSAAANAQPTAAAPLGTDAEAGPAIAAEPAVRAPLPTQGAGDDLTRIKGLGPKLAALLGEFGITTFAQIAVWDADEIERIDAKLGRFAGRITRDQWVEQARLLAAGDEAGFVQKFGRNG